MSENAGIYMNMPKSTRMAFLLHVSIVMPCLPEGVVTYFSKVYSMKEHEAVFLKRQIFPVVAGNIWFIFCFKGSIFTNKVQVPRILIYHYKVAKE